MLLLNSADYGQKVTELHAGQAGITVLVYGVELYDFIEIWPAARAYRLGFKDYTHIAPGRNGVLLKKRAARDLITRLNFRGFTQIVGG